MPSVGKTIERNLLITRHYRLASVKRHIVIADITGSSSLLASFAADTYVIDLNKETVVRRTMHGDTHLLTHIIGKRNHILRPFGVRRIDRIEYCES